MLSVFDPRSDKVWMAGLGLIQPERREVIEHALRYLGLCEDPLGSNDEPTGTLDGWLKAAGAPPGEPWCASALSSWLALKPRYAGAQKLGKAFPATPAPLAADILWYPTDAKGHGHCGLVLGVELLTDVLFDTMSLEGNCDNRVQVVRRRGNACQFARSPLPLGHALLHIAKGCPWMPTSAAKTR